MTNAKHRESNLHECAGCATDCKGSADYASYAFKNGNEDDARRYVKNLEENLSRLKGAMASLDYSNRQIAKDGPEADT